MTHRIRSIALIVLFSYAVFMLCPAAAGAEPHPQTPSMRMTGGASVSVATAPFSLAHPPGTAASPSSASLFASSPASPLTFSLAPPPSPAGKGGSPLNMRTAHKVFGYGAIALGAVAALSSKSEGLHCASAWGAAGLGAAALTTGIFKYRRVFDLGDGISKYDGHAILGGLAAAGFVIAVAMAGEGGDDDGHEGGEDDDDANLAHAVIGGAALGVMAVSVVVIKLKW